MCGILLKNVEDLRSQTKKEKSDKQHFREWIRNVDSKNTAEQKKGYTLVQLLSEHANVVRYIILLSEIKGDIDIYRLSMYHYI